MFKILKTPAEKRFGRPYQIAVVISLVLYLVCSQTSLRLHNTPAGIVLAGLAGAAFFAELVSAGLLIFKLRDEFQRTLLAHSFVWGTLITMAFSSIWGFIELHARGAVPQLDLVWIPIILICVTAAAKVLIFRRYRPENE